MARIRSIKPEYFASETIAALSLPARLTFIGLWTFADDAGRAADNAKLIKAAVWPLDDAVTAAEVAGHLDELAALGRICRYTADGKRYLHMTTWDEHQRVKNPSERGHPDCPRSTHGGPDPHGADQHVSTSANGLPPSYPRATPGQDPRARSRAAAEQGAGSREVGEGAGSREGEHEGEPPPDADADDAVGRQAADDDPDPPEAEVVSIADYEARQLCEQLADEIHAWSGERPPVGKRWLTAARLLLTKDGYSADQVRYLIHWATGHEFWRSNILSMPKLREKRLTLIGQIQRERGGGGSHLDRARAASVAELSGGGP